MLVIDNRMLNLARMQEAVLRRSINDRESNLEKYKNTVVGSDKEAFDCMLSELEQINEHNQTLEDELQFLELLRDSYNQLLELQLGFKRVCDLFEDNSLELSDLSQINIEYIENRINVINGYLINLKNIDINKSKLEELNIQLIDEEKKKKYLSEKMLELEGNLRKQFLDAEGRIIKNGSLVPTSVVLEYQKLGIDFVALLKNKDEVNNLLEVSKKENDEMEDKLKTAEICYNSAPSKSSKQVYDEIMLEYLNFKYRLTMLKILELLISNCNSYDMFKEKREKLLDLIKYRVSCLSKLDIKFSVDPFDRVKISEQFEMMGSFVDNSNKVNKIKREIIQVSERVDEMENQNNEYMVQLNNAEDLVLSRTSINDIDISDVNFDVIDYFEEEPVVLDNQVVDVKDISEKFYLDRARQKANLVVVRVNDMHNQPLIDTKDVKEEVAPKLVIVPKPILSEEKIEKNEDSLVMSFDDVEQELVEPVFEHDDILTVSYDEDDLDISDKTEFTTYDSDIFETVTPFDSTPMFVDRTDDSLEKEEVEISDSLSVEELEKISNKKDSDLELYYDFSGEDEMPDAFWVTQDDEVNDEVSDFNLSFDEQINALLKDDNNIEDSKVKKLEFVKSDGFRRGA